MDADDQNSGVPGDEHAHRPFWDERFTLLLSVVTAIGVGLRVVVLVVSKWDTPLGRSDAGYYYLQGRLIREGHGFADPGAWLYHGGKILPSASHPPLFSLVTAFADLVGFHSVNRMRLVCCLIGGAGIVMLALLGRKLGGARVGIFAAVIAAVYPLWLVSDDLVMSEVLYLPLVAGLLLLAYRLWERPTPGRAALVGLVGGLAALTRSEGLLVLILVVGAVAVLRNGLDFGRRALVFGTALVVALATLVPWIAYNASRFDDFVVMSTNDGATFADTNCPAAYSGPLIGLWVFGCHAPIQEASEESVRSAQLRDLGLHYAKDHAGRVPVVVAARIGRVWGLFRPFQTLDADSFGKWAPSTSKIMVIGYWLVAGFGIAGFFVLRRRRVPISPLVAALVSVTITAAITYGIARFRVPGDAVFVVLAAVSVDALIRRRSPAAATPVESHDWQSVPV
jgi:4-amino-4-deoxy-L-arabinose transferase-like glycosyltransferase